MPPALSVRGSLQVVIGSFEFRPPSLLPNLAAGFFLVLLIGLGFWQLNRAEQKEAMIDDYEGDLTDLAQDLGLFRGSTEFTDFQPVYATGRFEADKVVFLDNQVHRGVPGYQVLVPFAPQTGGAHLLVNLGWVPQTGDRAVLPRVTVPEGPVELEGRLKRPPEKVFRLGPDDPAAAGGPWVVQALEIDPIGARIGLDLEPFVVLLDPDAPYGLVREWRPARQMTPMKHRSYAFQWFALALALVMIYVTVNVRRAGPEDTDETSTRNTRE